MRFGTSATALWLSGTRAERVVTDTLPIRPGAPGCVEVVSCVGLLAATVSRIFTEDSVSSVFDGQNQVF